MDFEYKGMSSIDDPEEFKAITDKLDELEKLLKNHLTKAFPDHEPDEIDFLALGMMASFPFKNTEIVKTYTHFLRVFNNAMSNSLGRIHNSFKKDKNEEGLKQFCDDMCEIVRHFLLNGPSNPQKNLH